MRPWKKDAVEFFADGSGPLRVLRHTHVRHGVLARKPRVLTQVFPSACAY